MRKIQILGAVVLIVVAAWTAGWFYLANEVKKGITAFAVADGILSPKLSCQNLNVGGFPFRFDMTCTGAALVDGDFTANLTELRATVLVYQPAHVLVFAKGPVDFADAFTGSRSRLDWSSLEASARLTDWRIGRISLVLDSPVWTDTLAGETPIANAAHAEFHLLDIPEQLDREAHAAALAVHATLSGVVAPGFEIDQGEAGLDAEISGLPDDVRGLSDPDLLRRWQAAGGQLKLVGLKGTDPDQSFDVSGTLALNDAGLANGQLNVNSKGLVERFGTIIPENLRGLILGNPGADGTYSQMVTLHSGVIFSGILPAGLVPPLW